MVAKFTCKLQPLQVKNCSVFKAILTKCFVWATFLNKNDIVLLSPLITIDSTLMIQFIGIHNTLSSSEC